MGFDQYHEPPGELPERTRTFARLCASLTEEAEAIIEAAVRREYVKLVSRSLTLVSSGRVDTFAPDP